MGAPLLIAFLMGPLILFSKVSSASLISQSGSFELPAVMGCTGVALLSQSITHRLQPHRLQWTMLLRLELDEPSSRQSHNLLT